MNPAPPPAPPALDEPTPEAERRLAARLFNEVWRLLDRPDRSADDDTAMLHAAHASRHHWQGAGGPREWAIGEWQISRVYAVLGRAEPAAHHARLCLGLAERHALGAFLEAEAHEAAARAAMAAGDAQAFDRSLAAADAAAARIRGEEDRRVFAADRATLRRPG